MSTESMPTEHETAATVFELLSDETRVAVVHELATVEHPLSFGVLCSRVGCDDSGQFNYHLNRLRGALVEKTDDGYVLTPTGERAAMTTGALATASE